MDAKALLASGVKLFQAKDYLGALAVFKDAYDRFPSTKILLNIATTLKALDRNADAANTYQRYLDASDADPDKRDDVAKVIAELDAKVGIVEVSVSPATAEIQFAGEDTWHPAFEAAHYRVPAGPLRVRARAEHYEPAELTSEIAAGKRAPLAITLAPVPEAPAVTELPTSAGGELRDDGELAATRPSRLGAYLMANFDVSHEGGAARVAATYEVLPRLQAELGAIVGPSSGAYAGARYGFLPGRIRPQLAVGLPVFIKDGAHVAVRGAAGIELVVTPHISVIAEAGVERLLNPGMDYVETVFVPSIGAAGRL
jgi:hypothetical protein